MYRIDSGKPERTLRISRRTSARGARSAPRVAWAVMRAMIMDAVGRPLSVREVADPEPPRGGVVVEVRATGLCRSDWHAWAGHDDIALPHVTSSVVVLLVHGYAVRPEGALDRYGDFLHSLILESLNASLPTNMTFIGVLWPGSDPEWAFNILTFGSRVSDAERAGERLSEVMRGLGNKTVIVVAHSLGCRLALEYLWQARQTDARDTRKGPTPTLGLLMAAAVPTFECEGNGKWARRPPGVREVVLYSTSDRTLFGAFPAGSRNYTPGRAEAVGRKGAPIGRWDRASKRMNLDHGDYWASRSTAHEFAQLLNVAASRTLPARDSSRRPLHTRVAGSRRLRQRGTARAKVNG